MKDELINQLNAPSEAQRLKAAKELKKLVDRKIISTPAREGYTNNHVHTKYSFSPYSPSKAVWMAVSAGLSTVGIIDHDAINGAEEFIRAGEILGIPTTIGFEMRTDWSETPLNGRSINNPDQISNAYICAHGLAHTRIEKADGYLSRIRRAREKRNRAMTDNLNGILRPLGIHIDYDKDVLALSYAKYGGEVTERHLLFALSKILIGKFGRGEPLVSFLKDKLNIEPDGEQAQYLADEKNEIYEYDLLNVLKSGFVSRIYEKAAADEAPPVKDAVEAIKALGAIPTYCYLGDVDSSPTGDKKAQRFEDAYLDELFRVCREIGFRAIAYMPSRNTIRQLERVMDLCRVYGFMQINGEDINQPRQRFVCAQLKEPRFSHLADSTWALIGHEKAATEDINEAMFAGEPDTDERTINELIAKYKIIGLGETEGKRIENKRGQDLR